MSFEETCLPLFAGHQTFHPRFGWLKKCVDAVSSDPKVFSSEDATVRLGVGKNMVEAIRFWGQAAKLIENKNGEILVTDFGNKFVSDNGFDPYLEDVSTLWLIHWKMMQRSSLVPVWWLTFNEYSGAVFSQQKLSEAISAFVLDSSLGKKPIKATLDKDVDALLRMYSRKTAKGRQSLEDILDSPFRDLGLIIPNEMSDATFRFVFGRKPSLSSFAVLYACLDFMIQSKLSARTVTLARLATDELSPGKIFKLDVEALRHYLESSHFPGFQITSSAGALQLSIESSPDELMDLATKSYYSKVSN